MPEDHRKGRRCPTSRWGGSMLLAKLYNCGHAWAASCGMFASITTERLTLPCLCRHDFHRTDRSAFRGKASMHCLMDAHAQWMHACTASGARACSTDVCMPHLAHFPTLARPACKQPQLGFPGGSRPALVIQEITGEPRRFHLPAAVTHSCL